MNKSRISLITLFLILALVIASGVAQAQGQSPDKGGRPDGQPENYRGVLVAVGAEDITITDKETGEQVTIAVTPSTKVKVRGIKKATLADLQIDGQVIVQALRGEDESLTARRIGSIPGKPEKMHRVGLVTELSESSITIQNDEGETFTYTITPETKIVRKNAQAELAVGAVVTIIAPRNTDQPNLAAGIVVHGPEDGDETDEGEGNKPPKEHSFRNGLIIDLTENSITLQNEEGETFTFTINADTLITYQNDKAELAVGFSASVSIAPGDAEPPIAARIEVRGPEDDEEEGDD